jgi:diguanylate cyclase (GGDEF)-like protein
MPRRILITGAVKADSLRIRHALRRHFPRSVIQVKDGSKPAADDSVLVAADGLNDGTSVYQNGNGLEKKIRRTEFLLDAMRILAAPNPLDDILRVALTKSNEVLGDTSFVFLLQENGLDLRPPASSQPEQLPSLLESLLNLRSEVRDCLLEVIRRGEALLIPNLSEAVLPGNLRMVAARFGFRSLIAIPIKNDDEIHGVFVTISSTELEESQREICNDFAHVLAQSISRARVFAEMEQRANTDGLTGLYNKRFLDEVLEREVARAKRHKLPLAMLMLDMDNFKRINDFYGHVTADDALKSLAAILSTSLRREDFVFRYGGDEFSVVLPDTDLEGAAHKAEVIRESVEKASFVPPANAKGLVTVSIGVAAYESGIEPTVLMDHADQALLAAKANGRNRVEIYKPGGTGEGV